MRLSELEINEESHIDYINDSAPTNQLYERGILPGCKIKLIKRSKWIYPLYQIEDMFMTIDDRLIELINVK
jgi:Fe2+ transport system protein FeoA